MFILYPDTIITNIAQNFIIYILIKDIFYILIKDIFISFIKSYGSGIRRETFERTSKNGGYYIKSRD